MEVGRGWERILLVVSHRLSGLGNEETADLDLEIGLELSEGQVELNQQYPSNCKPFT